MRQFIASKVLRVNGEPSPCECEPGVVCAYCVQAGLLLWEREERPESARTEKLCAEIQRVGVRRVARSLGTRHQTVLAWVKSGRVNPSKLAQVESVLATLA